MSCLINIEEYKASHHLRNSIVKVDNKNSELGEIIASSNNKSFLERELKELERSDPNNSYLLI